MGVTFYIGPSGDLAWSEDGSNKPLSPEEAQVIAIGQLARAMDKASDSLGYFDLHYAKLADAINNVADKID